MLDYVAIVKFSYLYCFFVLSSIVITVYALYGKTYWGWFIVTAIIQLISLYGNSIYLHSKGEETIPLFVSYFLLVGFFAIVIAVCESIAKDRAADKDNVVSDMYPASEIKPNVRIAIQPVTNNSQDKIIYCRKCGKKLQDDSIYCSYCGEKL